MDSKFGSKVKTLRKQLGLSQAELAVKLHVDKQTVSRWERGERRPSRLAQRQLDRLNTKIKEE